MSFQLIDHQRSFIDGDGKDAGEAMVNGNVVWVNATGSVFLHSGGSAPYPHGFAYSRRTNVYRPTSITIPITEKMNVIRGGGQVVAPAALFTEAVIPAVNARIFAGAAGLMTTTAGANLAIGRCVGQEPVLDYIGLGTATNEARIEFDFPPTR